MTKRPRHLRTALKKGFRPKPAHSLAQHTLWSVRMHSLDFLLSLEQFRNPFTDAFFRVASTLGSEEAYMVVLTAIYLCAGHRLGFHLWVMFLLSAYTNAQLKLIAQTPRPFVLYPDQVHPIAPDLPTGASFPSGHAQNAATTWGIIAIRLRSDAARGLILALVALIGLSRLYCHVHWPIDVVGGYAAGGALILLYLTAIGAWQMGRRSLEAPEWALIIALASVVMYGLSRDDDVALRSTGALLGSGLGYLLLERRGYKALAPLATQALKLAVALAVLIVVRIVGKIAFGESEPALAARYALIGFFAAYLIPVGLSEFHALRIRLARGGRR